MALFNLGENLVLKREVGVGPQEAWRRGRELLLGYEELGFQVSFSHEIAPSTLVGNVKDGSGTLIRATVVIGPNGPGSELAIQLEGRIHVGGMKGMFASEGQVRKVAEEKLGELLDRKFPLGELSGPAPVDPEPEETASPPMGTPATSASPTAAPSSPAQGGVIGMDELEGKLQLITELHQRGLITLEDLKEKKQDLLGRL